MVYTCRICLKPGDIPIFGDDEKPDVSTEVKTFGDVDISLDDELPQHLCIICLELLQGAILFRNTAKESEITIKSNNFFTEGKYLDVDEEDLVLETRDSDDDWSNSSENGNMKIADDLCDIKTSAIERGFHGNDNDSEMIMIVVSDDEDCEKKIDENHLKYSCETCKLNFQTSDDYCQHTKTIEHKNNMKELQNLECYICDKFICKDVYVSHMIKHSFTPVPIVAGKYQCKLCRKVLLSEQDLKIHKESEQHKMAIKNAYSVECPICHSSVRKNNLKLHIKRHVSKIGQNKKKKCPICNKNVGSAYYKHHLKRVHNNSKDEPSQSQINGQINTSPKTESTKTFICDKCGKGFSKAFNFKLHCQTHGGELKYKCMFCPYRGLHQGLLKVHVRTHTGDYNYECDECPARFITKSNLNKHKRTHLGPIQFKCTICDKGFYTKLYLERHNDVAHSGVKKHVCNICGKAFGYRNNMMCHQLKVHKREKLTKGKGRLPNYLVAEIDEKK